MIVTKVFTCKVYHLPSQVIRVLVECLTSLHSFNQSYMYVLTSSTLCRMSLILRVLCCQSIATKTVPITSVDFINLTEFPVEHAKCCRVNRIMNRMIVSSGYCELAVIPGGGYSV